MKVIKTPLEGLLLLEPTVFYDERGLFYESWKDSDYKRSGIEETFVQDNVSISHKNVLRGLHYQEGQGQLVTVLKGVVFDVVVDIRPDSVTYAKHFSIELSSEKPQQLYMSPGFAHGFYVLSDYVIMGYKCTHYYNKSKEGGIIWNDPFLSINWPCVEDPIVSEKDGSFSVMKDRYDTCTLHSV